MEEANRPPPTLEPDEELAEKWYAETTIQQDNKRYKYKLPFKPNAKP